MSYSEDDVEHRESTSKSCVVLIDMISLLQNNCADMIATHNSSGRSTGGRKMVK